MKWDFKSELVSVPVKDWYDIKTGKLSQSSNKEKNELKVRFKNRIKIYFNQYYPMTKDTPY